MLRLLLATATLFGEEKKKKKVRKKKRERDEDRIREKKKKRRTSDIKWKNTVTVVELIVICVLHSVGIFQIVIGVVVGLVLWARTCMLV